MSFSSTPDGAQLKASGRVVFAGPQAAALLEGRLDSLTRPEAARWETVKQNASRTVYRGQIDGQTVYLKHFHSRSLLRQVGRRFGASDARYEMRFLQYLSSHGVPTPQPLAAMCDANTEWLATLAVAPAIDADAWHASQLARGDAGRRAIRHAIAELGRMIGRMHASGVVHLDLHCGNVLVRDDGPLPQLVLTDMHRSRMRRRLSRRSRAANLAQLFHDRLDFTTRGERLRFLKHYLQACGEPLNYHRWQPLIEHFGRRHRAAQYAKRDRRIVASNRYFHRLRLARGWSGHAVLATKNPLGGSPAATMTFKAHDWQRVLAQPESLFLGADMQIVKNSASSLVVRRRLKVGPNEVDVFIKRTRRKFAWKALPDCFRPARPIRAFRLGHQLLTRRIVTALPLAAMQRRVGPCLTDSILIAEAVPAADLNTFLNTHLADDARVAPAQRRQVAQEVLRQLGLMVQRLHDNRFAHRDLKSNNVLVRWSPGQSPQVVLIDLDGLRRVRHLTIRRRCQGLMRVNVSLLECPAVNHAGRLRMLLSYLRRPGGGRVNFKPYWRAVEQWSARKLQRQIRSRRKRQKAARRPE